MDYNGHGFDQKLRSYVILIPSEICYEVDICGIMVFFSNVKFSVSDQKPWTIVRGFEQRVLAFALITHTRCARNNNNNLL